MKRKVGIVVAVTEEQAPFLKVFGMPSHFYKDDCYDIVSWNKYRDEIYLIKSGYGEIAAASATQHLIDKFDVEQIINYGVVGGLSEDLRVGDIGIVRKVVHYGFDVSATGKYPVGRYPKHNDLFFMPKKNAFTEDIMHLYKEFVCASADKFVEGREAKMQLRRDYGADICEMESAGIIITCNRNNIPCSFLKIVSDSINEGNEAFNKNVNNVSTLCVNELAKILLKI